MVVKFRKRLFCKIFWLLKAAFENVRLRFIWVYGGSSASKTYSVVQLLIRKMMEGRDETAMVFRKYSVDIEDSIYTDFKTIIDKWGLTEKFLIQHRYIEYIPTGAYIRFRGLDDSEKIKGLSGFKRIVLEEISQFAHSDLKQIRKRLRGRRGQQIICIFNPVSEDHWIKKEVFDKAGVPQFVPAGKDYDDQGGMWVNAKGEIIDTSIAGLWVNEKGNMVVMKTNYLDNPYIVGPLFTDQATIDDFEDDRVNDPEYFDVYGLGNWGKIRTGGEFWKDFKDTNKTDIGWCKSQAIFLIFDENVNPYLPCQVWQLYSRGRFVKIKRELTKWHPEIWNNPNIKYLAVQIDEIFLADPLNRTWHVTAEFARRYPVEDVPALKIGGDRTAIKEDTKKEKGENFFTDIMAELRAYEPHLKMQGVNPSVAQSGKFVNRCYRAPDKTGIAILINRKCEKSIHDYQYIQELSDGSGYNKDRVTIKKKDGTKMSYEKFGHASDCKRYLVTTNFPNEYAEFLKGGKKLRPITGTNTSKNSY